MSGNIVVYEDVKAATQNDSIYIIDVREPKELASTGVIPNSINIPLGDVADVFGKSTADDFKKKYGRPKPEHSTTLIFSCGVGARAARAADAISKLGFKNIKIYSGSWRDWAQHLAQ